MRHRRVRRKLGVTTKHRKAKLRNMVRSLVLHKKIRTTMIKAKEVSAFADQMVTIAKRGDLHARRVLEAKLGSAEIAKALIRDIAPHFKNRQGGYTRVLRLGSRLGDGAETALLEFTETIQMPEKAKKPKKLKKEKAASKKDDSELEKLKAEKDKKPSEGEKEKADKKESEKRGGFLGALRKFLKGDDQR
ncbi:MAG: 50S ribosomal protein L17 [Candidatus Omnitrophica bacterium]|nr:50S ribosomal protein L17 [Candidatus Omnitrophota bacterium]